MIIALQTLLFFRESVVRIFDQILRPYYKRLSMTFITKAEDSDDEEPDEQVFAEYDDQRGVVFFPPVYSQRYAAVSDCLMDERWRGKLEKVIDLGYHDMSLIKYLKEVPGIQRILGVDIETLPLRYACDAFAVDEYTPRRETPLQITLYQGNAADPDYRLIGCDAVIAIEMIEHMLPHDLERLVHNVFGFIKPWIAVFSTPNGDFNVLFKSLEKNGYRRLDHFFEWSREQFNEWCSNIVYRYPNYTVSCQGIGPGPPGTLHHGCCSQLALFVNKQYHKQQDLNINSLALIPMPNPPATSEMAENWGTAIVGNEKQTEIERIGTPYGIGSLTEFICNENQSNMTFVYSPELTSSLAMIPILSDSEQSILNSDKISQCDLDSEYGKNFLMFDNDETFLDVRLPFMREPHRVYNIEDVVCRLNCSTLQIKKFSKTTQNLMARNKLDTIGHTQEVVDEIRQLTKTLKLNKCIMDRPEEGSFNWCNINWGDDAPYWNQYYKVVKEYNYPFEVKSDECRILDLISEEINNQIDTQCDEATTFASNRVEIPLTYLMTVVNHITDDINMVRDLLEWNGYEVVNDVVIYSRLAIDTVTVGTHEDEWPDNASHFSDWDNVTEVPSTTVSDGSTIVPESQDRSLRRALDQKLHNLRTMFAVDEDITTELDKVVCKLMKLALRTTKRRTTPPPAKWMQCKLLDLLTLTEKAIQRRKKHVIENSFNAITYDFVEDYSKQKNVNINVIEDTPRRKINNDSINMIDTPDIDNADILKYQYEEIYQIDDILSSTSNEIKDFEYTERIYQPLMRTAHVLELKPEQNPMERTKAWLNVNVEEVSYPIQQINHDNNSSGDSDSVSYLRRKEKRLRCKSGNNSKKEMEIPSYVTSSSKSSSNKCKSKHEDKKRKANNTRVTKKVAKRVAASHNIMTNPTNKNSGSYGSYIATLKRKPKGNQCLTMRTTKPIPESLIELCHPELKLGQKYTKAINVLNIVDTTSNVVVLNKPCSNTAAEESVVTDIDILMDDTQEKIICYESNTEDIVMGGTSNKNQFDELSNDFDINLCTRHEVSKESIVAETIFLNDINEPSTSKGIRHNVSMDVQCGPDTSTAHPMLSATTSFVRLPLGFSRGIKINDGTTDFGEGQDFGTSTHGCCGCEKILTPQSRSIRIKIKDSDVNIFPTPYSSTQGSPEICSPESRTRCWTAGPRSWSPESNSSVYEKQVSFVSPGTNSPTRSEILKPILNISNTDNAVSEYYCNNGTICKSISKLEISPLNNNEVSNTLPNERQESKVVESIIDMKRRRPKLSCGGVHVHSYKDKEESEDIVFQGKWQRCRPKFASRKKTQNTILAKKIFDSGNKKQRGFIKDKRISSVDKIPFKKLEKKEYKADYKKPSQVRNKTSIRPMVKQEIVTTSQKIVPKKTFQETSNKSRISRDIVNVTRVASKITMSSTITKNTKTSFTIKKLDLTSAGGAKKEINAQKIKKNYLPLYMRKRNTQIFKKTNFNESIDSADCDLEDNKETSKQDSVYSISLKTDKIKKDLLSFQGNVPENTYVVLQSEHQDNPAPSDEQPTIDNAANDDNYFKPTYSHHSLTSSTCSSPNSIVTVRAVNTKLKNLSYRRHSASSHKTTVHTSESDNPTPNETRKSNKRPKTMKRTDNNCKESNNKENIPNSAQNLTNKETDKLTKSPFMGQRLCIAQLKTDRPSMQTMTPKYKSATKSNIKITTLQDTIDKKRSISASVSQRRSFQSRNISVNDMDSSKNSLSDDGFKAFRMEHVLSLQNQMSRSNNMTSSEVKSVENNKNTHVAQVSQKNKPTRNITNDMSLLVEELIHRIDFPSSNNSLNSSLDANDSDSFNNFATVTANFLSSTIDSDKALNRTFDPVLGNESTFCLARTRLSDHDTDLLSFKSVTSLSKESEYFIANSELNIADGGTKHPQSSGGAVVASSVTDIFERKEPRLMQKPPGPLAAQAFSGFSIDCDPVTGEQPDPISLIDSETGSMTITPARIRQVTSEELYISATSSESYQSHQLDEDAVVPNWLFQIISQQHSQVLEEDQPMIGPHRAPVDDASAYDLNGNPIEQGLIDAAAGAGDGRGIHSDQSQNSSGRGTSLSSSETSSSPQSEAILIDPSAFTGQIELLRDSEDGLASGNLIEGTNHMPLTTTSLRRPRTSSNEVSDISADISSIGTDAPDSSD